MTFIPKISHHGETISSIGTVTTTNGDHRHTCRACFRYSCRACFRYSNAALPPLWYYGTTSWRLPHWVFFLLTLNVLAHRHQTSHHLVPAHAVFKPPWPPPQGPPWVRQASARPPHVARYRRLGHAIISRGSPCSIECPTLAIATTNLHEQACANPHVAQQTASLLEVPPWPLVRRGPVIRRDANTTIIIVNSRSAHTSIVAMWPKWYWYCPKIRMTRVS